MPGDVDLSGGDLFLLQEGLDLTPGDVDLTLGGVDLSGGDLFLSKGGLDLTPGDVDLTPGDPFFSKGSLDLTSGDLDLSPGDLDLSPGDVGDPGALRRGGLRRAACRSPALAARPLERGEQAEGGEAVKEVLDVLLLGALEGGGDALDREELAREGDAVADGGDLLGDLFGPGLHGREPGGRLRIFLALARGEVGLGEFGVGAELYRGCCPQDSAGLRVDIHRWDITFVTFDYEDTDLRKNDMIKFSHRQTVRTSLSSYVTAISSNATMSKSARMDFLDRVKRKAGLSK